MKPRNKCSDSYYYYNYWNTLVDQNVLFRLILLLNTYMGALAYIALITTGFWIHKIGNTFVNSNAKRDWHDFVSAIILNDHSNPSDDSNKRHRVLLLTVFFMYMLACVFEVASSVSCCYLITKIKNSSSTTDQTYIRRRSFSRLPLSPVALVYYVSGASMVVTCSLLVVINLIQYRMVLVGKNHGVGRVLSALMARINADDVNSAVVMRKIESAFRCCGVNSTDDWPLIFQRSKPCVINNIMYYNGCLQVITKYSLLWTQLCCLAMGILVLLETAKFICVAVFWQRITSIVGRMWMRR